MRRRQREEPAHTGHLPREIVGPLRSMVEFVAWRETVAEWVMAQPDPAAALATVPELSPIVSQGFWAGRPSLPHRRPTLKECRNVGKWGKDIKRRRERLVAQWRASRGTKMKLSRKGMTND